MRLPLHTLPVLLLSWALALTFALPAFAATAAGLRNYNLPAGPLGRNLSIIAAQSGLPLSFNPILTQGLKSRPLSGDYTPRQALNYLLRGSNLMLIQKEDGSYTLQKQEKITTLPPVSVSAGALDSPGTLPLNYAGDQVADGGRLGVLGNTSLAKAPFNLSAYTHELIETQQARSVSDLLVNNDASVRVIGGRGDINDDFLIRGFAVSSQDISINGLYGLLPYWRVPIEFAERLELLRGPSATLGGMPPSGGVGGTINVVPKRASMQDLTRLSVDFTQDAQIGTHLDLGRRFGAEKAFGLRFNGVYRQGDTAVDDQQREFPMASLALDYQGEKLSMTMDVLAQQEHLNGVIRPVIPQSGVAVPDVPDASRRAGMRNSYSDQKMISIISRAEYMVNEQFALFAAFGGRQSNWDTEAANILLLNATSGAMLNGSARQRADRRTYSAEAGVRASVETGAIFHELTLSLNRMDHEEGLVYLFFPMVPGNLYQAPTPLDIDASVLDGPIPTTTENVFSGLSLTDRLSLLEDRLQLTLGARRQWITTNRYDPTTGAKLPGYDEQVWTPMLGINYGISDHLSIYANAIEGLSQGERAPPTASNPNAVLAPYRTRQYEIGMKYDSGRMGASWSAFEIEKPNAFVDASNVFREDGEQRNRGLEVNIFGEPIDGLRLLGGLSYIRAKQLKTEGGINDGNDARGVPRRQANIGVYWQLPPIDGASLNARWIYTSESYLNQSNTFKVPSWQRYDVGANYRFVAAGRPVRLSINIENVLDEDYWQSASFYDGLTISAPRTVILAVTIDF